MAIQDAVDHIQTVCTKWNLGYNSEGRRLNFYDGGETDCSALVIFVCEQAGLLPGNNIKKHHGATFTQNMRKEFSACGWKVLPVPAVSQLKPGDVLLRDQHGATHGHTAMYVGHGHMAYASSDKDGKAGDGSGTETLVARYHPDGWDCVLRFQGTANPTPPGPPAKDGGLDVDGVIGPRSARKLRAVLGLPAGEVIDEVTVKAVQAHVGAPYHDGIASNQNAADIAAHWPALKSFTVGSGGSESVKALQKWLGMTGADQDGELGGRTARALQTRLNTGRL
ncbi:MAG TPA: NlpC/P60 family protein [Mycobacteriales bacterium]|nr:NlpC/P60 family protein [Mycobacteriales bacterium]